MRVIVLIALAVLTLAILAGIFIYDKTRKDRITKMLVALKKLHKGSITTKKTITREALITEYPCSTIVFNDTLTRLKDEDFIVEEEGKIRFTPWGKKYYETKIENASG